MSDADYDDEDTYNRIEPDVDDGDDGADPNEVAAPSATAVLEYLARAVVDDPDGVDVDVDDGGGRVSLEVRVSDGDMGRVIGKRGRVANAIRTVVRAAAAQDGSEVDVEFVD